jgi:hypothetical protein
MATTIAAIIHIHAIRDVREAITITSVCPSTRRIGRQAGCGDLLPHHSRYS